jgi:hypothetical protein
VAAASVEEAAAVAAAAADEAAGGAAAPLSEAVNLNGIRTLTNSIHLFQLTYTQSSNDPC